MAVGLSQGQVADLDVDELTVSVRHSAAIELSALLLTDRGRVRGAGDLIFYNQPSGPGVGLISTAGQSNSLVVNLYAVPPGIEHVRVVIALADQHAHLGDYPAPQLCIADIAGNLLYEYVIEGLEVASTVVAVDLDRTGPGWRVRALGQSYRSGFATLVTAHGVVVESSLAIASPQLIPGSPQTSNHPRASAAGHEVPLRKGSAALTYVKMALGWDPVRVHGRFGVRAAEIDLDASALIFAGDNLVDTAFYGKLSSSDGAVRHLGDNLTGAGKGDDETIAVDLTRLAPTVTAVVFTVTSYAGHTFERVRNAYWRLIDGATDTELARANLRVGGAHTGMVVAKVYRAEGMWKLRALDQPIQAGHPVEAAEQIAPFL
ncbi:TerD family protein [Nocardia sp. NBC_01499]|uniref:TerD family protein n=1 Tax=Nocardia sp. NBC_01499 TaxID=2903597 RepID=UPI003864C0F2